MSPALGTPPVGGGVSPAPGSVVSTILEVGEPWGCVTGPRSCGIYGGLREFSMD